MTCPGDNIDSADLSQIKSEILSTNDVFRQMVEHAWDGIAIHHDHGLYFANRAFRKIFDLGKRDDLSGIHIHKLLAPETRRDFFVAVQKAKSRPERPVFHEGRGLMPDGSIRYLDMSTLSTEFKGHPALVSVFRDVTERKQIEEHLQQSERLTATGKLAFHIAHEINNPLGGIITYSHLMLEDLADDVNPAELGDTVRKIIKLANRCKIIVGALLDFARHDREVIDHIQINEVIEETLHLLAGHIIMTGLTIEKDLSPDLPDLMANRTKIEQVFMNLIINAAEAMQGIGHLGISTAFDPKTSEFIIRITDTGPGITEEHKKRLFDPFFSTKPRGRGTGLGLSISHGIIKQHSGRIKVDSYPGQGTAFTITLPRGKI